MRPAVKILVIDDEADVAEFIAAAAEGLGYKCVVTTDAAAVRKLYTPDTNLILLDLMMPEIDGIEVLRVLSNMRCKASILLMSGIAIRVMETAEKLARALGLHIAGHLMKPFQLSELEDALRRHAASEAVVAVERAARTVYPDETLRNALVGNEFVLHYQPQIDLETGNVFGVEALARWQKEGRNLVYPDNFIPRVEALGLIDDFGWLVAERGMSEVKRFADGDRVAPRLALNVSVHSLRDLQFPDTLMSMLKKHGLPADGVMIEITESGLIDELSRSLDVLARLRVKIDKIFVLNMQMNNSDRVMVQKTIEIGHELGMKVTAEGVETREQLEFLRRQGCDSAQGYFFSPPLPAHEMVYWLDAYRSRPMN
jgi:EAL domain-containing protein (putative c-di-GMP-specific phosphodiesterase class I)/CheY-like chemotaxis protein